MPRTTQTIDVVVASAIGLRATPRTVGAVSSRKRRRNSHRRRPALLGVPMCCRHR
nr:hypothetical protein [Actinoplanes brasiliensis]